jgi:hypothetical protein
MRRDVFQTDRKRMLDKDSEQNCYERNALYTFDIPQHRRNVTRNCSKKRGKEENMFCVSLFHHVSDILFARFSRPREDEKNIGNGVKE